MSVSPYPINCYRDSKWTKIQTDALLPGDIVSIGECTAVVFVCPGRLMWLATPVRVNDETTVPADILLINGTCIVNEALLSGESTPLLKESIQLLDPSEKLDVDSAHKNAVLFSGTKILQASKSCMHVSPCSQFNCRLRCCLQS